MTQDKPLIRYHALAMVAGLPKLDRNFYNRDIERIIQEARALGLALASRGVMDAELTDEQANAIRAAFHTQDFRDIDALWLDAYDAKRASGQQPDAGDSKAYWYD